jgi:uncharacterized membrane-anchored protein
MKKMIPLCLALISVVLFLGIIFKNEQHLKNSQSVYVRLQPVDPRSFIQGDYMALSYQLYLVPQNTKLQTENPIKPNNETTETIGQVFSGHYYDERIKNHSSVLTFVELDQQRRVIHTYFDPPKNVKTVQLLLKNPDNRYTSLYPASKSFLFAEGLGKCYQAAQYAEFKVDQRGNAILASLRGPELQDLNCENKQRWQDGFAAANKAL